MHQHEIIFEMNGVNLMVFAKDNIIPTIKNINYNYMKDAGSLCLYLEVDSTSFLFICA